MSWWNTSNFSDLASKALKNAQKTIDSALDINERNRAGRLATGSPAKTETVTKSDVWGGSWTGNTASGDDAESSSWSFPWEAGAEAGKPDDTTESLVKVKSPEEIKSEVLKAAKERTKAKAKLFPQKGKIGSEHGKVDSETAIYKESHGLNVQLKSSMPPDMSGESCDKEKIVFGTMEHVEGNDRVKEIVMNYGEDKTLIGAEKQTFAELEMSLSEEYPTMLVSFTSDSMLDSIHGDNQMNVSGFQEVDEADVVLTDNTELIQTNELKEIDIVSIVEVKEEVYNAVMQESDIEKGKPLDDPVPHFIEYSMKAVPEKITETDNVTEEHANIIEDESTRQTEIVQSFTSEIETTDNSVIELTRDLSSGEISSSVEFVTDKDFTVSEAATVGETEDYCEQSSSDPEIIDCDQGNSEEEIVSDKANSDENVNKDVKPEQSVIHEPNIEVPDKVDVDGSETSPNNKEAFCEVKSEDECYQQQFLNENTEIVEYFNAENLKTESAELDSFSNIAGEDYLLMSLPDSVIPETVKSLRSSDSESSVNKLDSSMETCTSDDTIVDPCFNPDDTDEKLSSTANVQEINPELNVDTRLKPDKNRAEATDELDITDESNGTDTDKGNISPAHSFVKCMLEDVIEDGKQGDDNSDSHSSIEKSEGSRSVYSNQESGDEIDTTTSSDIEIISLPTPNGENTQVSPLDPNPLRIALQKTSWRGSPTHRRTDSSDSSSASGGNYELSPGRETTDYNEYHRSHSEHSECHSHPPELPALSEEDDNPYHPQRLLKDETNTEESHDMRSEGQMSPDPAQNSCDLDRMSHDVQTAFEKKLAEMAEVLQAREDKLLIMSKENCELMEAHSIIRNQLKQSEETREAEMTDVNELTTEFTQRLTDAEKRVSTAIREKDGLKKQLQDAHVELAKRAGDVNLAEILAEKEEQVAGLLQEGEKLSKSQLQSNTIIKKLRQKEKDNESTLTGQKKKIEAQTAELEHLHKVLESREDLEKKQTEAIAQLTSAVKKQEQEMVKLKSEHEDATEKARGLQVALDNSYKEMAELHRSNIAQDSKAHEAALSAEMQVREELKMAMEKQQQQHKWTIESLNMQIDDHRLSMTRMEKEYNRREDMLRQEITHVQKQLQEDEARTQELTQGVSLATRPLLRQIENLQSTHKAQSSTWEKVERNISERLSETQNQLAVATEKERTANDQLMDLGSRVTSLETQNSRLRQERSQMSAQLEMHKTKAEISEDAKQNEAAQIEVMKHQMSLEMHELKKQKVLLETQLDVEKSRVEQEKKKIVLLQEQLRESERELMRSTSRSRGTPVRGTPSPVSISRQDSMIGSFHEQPFAAITQEELDRSFVLSTANGNKQSLYEALRQSGAANLLENLQSQLKLREGEIIHLQGEIRSLERTRESMARELVDLSNRNDSLEEKIKDLPILEDQYKDLDQRYNALLQMYGEKTEQTDELKLDLQDVKDMYKAQINHLLGQSS